MWLGWPYVTKTNNEIAVAAPIAIATALKTIVHYAWPLALGKGENAF
jgi:hypothetical protein